MFGLVFSAGKPQQVQVVEYTEKSQDKHETRHVQLVREYGFHPRSKVQVVDGALLPRKFEPFPEEMYGRPLEEIDTFIYEEVSKQNLSWHKQRNWIGAVLFSGNKRTFIDSWIKLLASSLSSEAETNTMSFRKSFLVFPYSYSYSLFVSLVGFYIAQKHHIESTLSFPFPPSLNAAFRWKMKICFLLSHFSIVNWFSNFNLEVLKECGRTFSNTCLTWLKLNTRSRETANVFRENDERKVSIAIFNFRLNAKCWSNVPIKLIQKETHEMKLSVYELFGQCLFKSTQWKIYYIETGTCLIYKAIMWRHRREKICRLIFPGCNYCAIHKISI